MPREVPKFEKSSPELVARFGVVLDRVGTPDVTRRPMFGYPCAWLGGNMATGLFAQEWWVRVSEPRREALLALAGAHPFQVMPGRDMGRYVVLPDDVVEDDGQIDAWVSEALAYTATVPVKKK